jgi:hypothetical protein
MTLETRNTIELKDVVAIEYECAGCRAKTVRVLNDKHVIPLTCGNCNTPWFAQGSNEWRHLQDLVATFAELRSSITKEVGVRLEIAGVGEGRGR